ncbi:hypothetical protein, partial [Pseudoxanthomonas suwonensis]|uniref:hypothetical protein n=1 Tax=Pseudoxanthomonas suwonensis TaxID=314722 RepID=UPI001E3F909C
PWMDPAIHTPRALRLPGLQGGGQETCHTSSLCIEAEHSQWQSQNMFRQRLRRLGELLFLCFCKEVLLSSRMADQK